MRLLWLVITLMGACAVGYGVQANGADIWQFLGGQIRNASPLTIQVWQSFDWLLGVCFGGMAFVLFGFAGPALFDSISMAQADENLGHIGSSRRRRALRGADVIRCFDHREMLRRAIISVIGAVPTGGGDTKDGSIKPLMTPETKRQLSRQEVRGTRDMADAFGDLDLIDRRLSVRLFGIVPLLMTALGLVFIAQLLSLGGASVAAAALCLLLGSALVAAIVVRSLAAQNRERLARLRANLSNLLPDGLGDNRPVQLTEHVVQAISRLKESVDAGQNNYEKSQEEIVRAIKHTGMNTAEATAAAVNAALQKPVREMTKTAQTIAQKQSIEIEKLINASVDAFVSAMDRQLAASMENLADLGRAAADAAQNAEKSFKTATDALVKQQDKANQTAAKDFARSLNEIAKQLDKQAKQLERTNQESGKALAEVTSKQLVPSADKLAAAADGFGQLSILVEGLTDQNAALVQSNKAVSEALQRITLTPPASNEGPLEDNQPARKAKHRRSGTAQEQLPRHSELATAVQELREAAGDSLPEF